MSTSHLVQTPESTDTSISDAVGPPPHSGPDTLAYLELTPQQTFAVAYALINHCRRVGPPKTALQHEIAGLRDFLLGLLDDHQVETLLRSI